MYHTNGFSPMTYLLGGDRLVVLEKFDAATVVDAIERYRITNFTATPTMLARIAALPGIRQRDLSSVAWILQGAAVMPHALLRTWFDLLSPEQVVMAYGMTEGLGITALRGDEWLAHPGSVGRGFRDTEVRILDQHGEPVSPGELGEVYLRSPMSAGYRYLGGAPLLPSTPDGFRTAGDIGHVDADGYLYIADRRSDMIITGGANVFPAEVECALAEHDGIADVVVIGLCRSRVGSSGACRGPTCRQLDVADRAGRHRLRENPAGRIQGAQDGGVRRPDPPHGGDQSQPLSDGRSPRRLITSAGAPGLS